MTTEFLMNVPYGWGFYDSIRFVHARPAKNNKKRMVQAVRSSHSCREFFIRCMRNKFLGVHHEGIDTSKVYIMVGAGRALPEKVSTKLTILRRKFSKSLAIINSLERKYKWPMSKMYNIRPTGANCVPGVIFVGDRRWTKSPYLMSLYTLMIRAGSHDWVKDTVKNKTWDKLRPILGSQAGPTGGGADRSMVAHTLPCWELLLEYYKELFGHGDRAWQWSTDRLINPHLSTSEGIHKLVKRNTYNKNLLTKFNKIRKEAKV